jgi:hypothetical protein
MYSLRTATARPHFRDKFIYYKVQPHLIVYITDKVRYFEKRLEKRVEKQTRKSKQKNICKALLSMIFQMESISFPTIKITRILEV